MGFGYIYLDYFWLQNLIMNSLLLWTTSRCSRNRIKPLRLFLSAAFGAFYAIAVILADSFLVWNLAVIFFVSVIMLVIAFGHMQVRKFVKLTILFYGVTFLFGGAGFGLYHIFGTNNDITHNAVIMKNYPVQLLAASSFLSIEIFYSIWTFTRIQPSDNGYLYKIEIFFGEEVVSLVALLDTGNRLVDPLSQNPVIVVELDGIKDALLPEVRSIFEQSDEYNLDFAAIALTNSAWISRFRIIPFTALEKTTGVLIGFRPDKVRVSVSDVWHDVENVIIAVCNKRLCNDSRYRALIHPGIIIS